MIVNAKKMRKENMTRTFLNVIENFGGRLKMHDLDILNLACDSIKSIPFNYCVLENIYHRRFLHEAKEYCWLSKVYSDEELEDAKNNPVIVHYAGPAMKIWRQGYKDIPSYYWKYLEKSPFFDKEKYFPSLKRRIKYAWLWLLMKLCFIKEKRKRLKAKLRQGY